MKQSCADAEKKERESAWLKRWRQGLPSLTDDLWASGFAAERANPLQAQIALCSDDSQRSHRNRCDSSSSGSDGGREGESKDAGRDEQEVDRKWTTMARAHEIPISLLSGPKPGVWL